MLDDIDEQTWEIMSEDWNAFLAERCTSLLFESLDPSDHSLSQEGSKTPFQQRAIQ